MPNDHYTRLLRISVFKDRDLLSERSINPETSVAIDPAPRKVCSHCGLSDHVVTEAEGFPEQAIILFTIDETGQYFLNVSDTLEGSIRDTDTNRLLRLSEFREECKKNNSSPHFAVSEGCRGIIEWKELTVRFQFVIPPAPASRRPAVGHPVRNSSYDGVNFAE